MLDPVACRRLLEILLATGADDAEVYQEKVRRTVLSVDDGELDSAVSGEDGGVALRLVVGDRTFLANGNDTTLAGLEAAARRLAGGLGDAGGRRPPVPLPPALTVVATETPSPVLTSPDGVALPDKIDLVRRADAAARGADARIAQVTANYLDTVQEVQVATASGRLARDRRVICTLAVQVLARQGERLRTGYAVNSQTRGFELFTLHPPEETAAEATRLALLQLAAQPAPAGTFTVVLSSRAGGTMVHEACGHGLEGDFVEKGLSAYAGRLGQQVASSMITVVDDGTLPHARGSSAVDDEGSQTSRVMLIEKGILRGFLHSRRTASRMQAPPTGNGRRESFRHLPIPRMRNTMITPGETPPEAILASVKDGIFIAHMGGGEVDIASGNFVFNCSEAYRIRDGRLEEPLQDVTLAGCGPDVLRTIDMVGNDLGFQVGTCGKDGQGVPVADAQPTLRIPAIVVGGQAGGGE